jgi:hypothetical protein
MKIKEKLLDENTALLNLDDPEIVQKVIKDFFKGIAVFGKESFTEQTQIQLFSGPRVIMPNDGFEPYSDIPDMISFFFTVINNLPEENKKWLSQLLWNETANFADENTVKANDIYDMVIKAVNAAMPPIDSVSISRILSKCVPVNKLLQDMFVFTEFVHFKSVGQLLNNISNKQLRTEILYAEIIRGLRNDKTVGIPIESILNFFIYTPTNTLVETIDIDTIVINLFVTLYNIKNLDAHLDRQMEGITTEVEAIKNAFYTSLIKTREHYTNMKMILHNLVLRTNKCKYDGDLMPAVSVNTLSFILLHAPLNTYFVYDIFQAVLEMYKKLKSIALSASNNSLSVYLSAIDRIMITVPNLAILNEIIDTCTKDDYKLIINSLRIGFNRYTLHMTVALEKFIENNFHVGYSKEGGEDVLDPYEAKNIANTYKAMNYLERINFIIHTIPEYAGEKVVDEKDPRYIIYNSTQFKLYDLTNILTMMNTAINTLKQKL